MIEYLPWSKGVVAEALLSLKDGVFTTLDIELSGACPYNCVYCETPYRDKKSTVNFNKVVELLSSKQFKWVYICGIGEPTHGNNEDDLVIILEACKRYGARCSIFTNLSNLSERFIDYINVGILNIIFKYDSQNRDVLQELYNPDNLDKHLTNLNRAFQLTKAGNGLTNIAASIVPTKANVNELVSLVDKCINSGVFPLIGQLENCGAAKGSYSRLYLDDNELGEKKVKIDQLLNEEYHIPFCPSVLSGFHISNDNKITLDRRTGLSCHWFWLDEPKVEVVYDLNDNICIEEISKRIRNIREEKYNGFLLLKDQIMGDVFGGCGGNKREIFDTYITLMEGLKK